ncbi:MAG: hypothetical protein ACE37F_30600 [Nannocystaceae bacterium]|nr:hypothetical protein [bacterium]
MDEAFTLHRLPLNPQTKTRPEMPDGRVYVLGEPKVGLSLVIVGEKGVVQTGVVRRFERQPDALVVETDNSQYTLRVAA